jgi:sirohydrochlorin ferrochelatase
MDGKIGRRAGVKPGILVISHGSREREWVSRIDETVESAQAAFNGLVPVVGAFLELVEDRLIPDGLRQLEAEGVTDLLAIPFFVSSGSTHVDEIGWALGAYASPRTDTDLTKFRVNARLTYGKPLDEDEEIAEVLLDRLAELSADPRRESLLLVAHGSGEPEFLAAWRRGTEGLCAKLRERGGYADAEAALLLPDEVAEKWRALRRRRPLDDILALPLFLSGGYFTSVAVPKRLAGLDCRYNGRPLLPHPALSRWIVRQSRRWLENIGTSVMKRGDHG